MHHITITDQQRATLITALRYYQLSGQCEPSTHIHHIQHIQPMESTGLDELLQILLFDSEKALERFKADFNTVLAAMSDVEIQKSFADIGAIVDIRRPQPPMEGIQKQCWDAMVANDPGCKTLDEAFIKAVADVVTTDYGVCARDGHKLTGVLCEKCAEDAEEDGNCATCGGELGDDSYDGLCSDCAEHEVEKMASRGMSLNPKPVDEDA